MGLGQICQILSISFTERDPKGADVGSSMYGNTAWSKSDQIGEVRGFQGYTLLLDYCMFSHLHPPDVWEKAPSRRTVTCRLRLVAVSFSGWSSRAHGDISAAAAAVVQGRNYAALNTSDPIFSSGKERLLLARDVGPIAYIFSMATRCVCLSVHLSVTLVKGLGVGL